MQHTSLSWASVLGIWSHSICKTPPSSALPGLACWQLARPLSPRYCLPNLISHVGCAPAMINFNLSGDALLRCLRISGAVILLVDEDSGCQARIDQEGDKIKSELNMCIVPLSEDLKSEIGMGKAFRIGDQYRKDVCGDTPIALLYTRYAHLHQS